MHDESAKLDGSFALAFGALIDRLGREDLFCERVGSQCDGAPTGIDNKRISDALTEFAGDTRWTTTDGSEFWSHSEVHLLIEFFFKLASQPSDGQFHQFCGAMHWGKFDSGKGRYAYTVEVNNLLVHHQKRFSLAKGKLVLAGDPVLNDCVRGLKLPSNDLHLRKLVSDAVVHFNNVVRNERLTGLQLIVNAFERLKTVEFPSNKKTSVELLTKRLALAKEMAGHYEALFRTLTNVANGKTIRHHEHDIDVLDDRPTIEFLFYGYYNLVRFILEVRGDEVDASS